MWLRMVCEFPACWHTPHPERLRLSVAGALALRQVAIHGGPAATVIVQGDAWGSRPGAGWPQAAAT